MAAKPGGTPRVPHIAVMKAKPVDVSLVTEGACPAALAWAPEDARSIDQAILVDFTRSRPRAMIPWPAARLAPVARQPRAVRRAQPDGALLARIDRILAEARVGADL